MQYFCLFFFLVAAWVVPAEADKVSNESEGSVVVVGGNSVSQSYAAKQASAYEHNAHKCGLKGHYLMAKAGSLVSAENWDVGLRYDYAFRADFGAFAGETVSGDRFRNIHLQYDSDIGLKYTLWKATEKSYGLAELGYRLTRYDYITTDDITTHFARAYFEVSAEINEKVSGKFWVEYLPSLQRSSKYLVNFEPSLNVVLTQIFSLKTGLLGNYDSQPKAPKKFDYTYTLALIAKY